MPDALADAYEDTSPGELTLQNITVDYDGALALDDVTIAVQPRTVTAVLGPNGAGKTTLAGVAGGTVKPKAGKVLLDGTDITRMPAWKRSRVGLLYIPERRGLFPGMSVEENLRMAFRHLGRRGAAVAIADAESAFPVLADRRKQVAGALSGGEQQMLALCRVIAGPSRVVVLDELSHGLAPKILDGLFGLLETRRHTLSVLLIEQYVDRALAIADQIVVLVRGSVSRTSPRAEVSREDVEMYYRLSAE